MMRVKFLAAAAALVLLSACSSAPESAGNSVNGGGRQRALSPNAMAAANGLNGPVVQQSGDRVFFAYDSYSLLPEAVATLAHQAQWIKQNPSAPVTIEGHADERGTREYNLALGEKRAMAVKKYFVSVGIPAARINVISYGKERPAVVGSNEAAWAQNRRSVTVVGR